MTTGGLTIRVDSGGPVPPFEQIRAQLADLISVGRLREGDRLPPYGNSPPTSASPTTPSSAPTASWSRRVSCRSRRGSGTRVAASAAGAADEDTRATLAEHARDFMRRRAAARRQRRGRAGRDPARAGDRVAAPGRCLDVGVKDYRRGHAHR